MVLLYVGIFSVFKSVRQGQGLTGVWIYQIQCFWEILTVSKIEDKGIVAIDPIPIWASDLKILILLPRFEEGGSDFVLISV